MTEEEKLKYIEKYAKMGIDLEKEKLEDNEGKGIFLSIFDL